MSKKKTIIINLDPKDSQSKEYILSAFRKMRFHWVKVCKSNLYHSTKKRSG